MRASFCAASRASIQCWSSDANLRVICEQSERMEPPPNNSGNAYAAQKKEWAKQRKEKSAATKAQGEARAKREEEKEKDRNHRMNRTAAAEREEVGRRERRERDQACRDAARKRKEKAQKALDKLNR